MNIRGDADAATGRRVRASRRRRTPDANLGFGRGHNAAAARGSAPFILILNQDCVLEPGVLAALVASAAAAPVDVAAWELRQVPYEHPKSYDPVSLDTPWASGAALLLRRKAFEAIGGFEPRIFMYGEDVDFSWRLRAKGWRVVYQPRFAVVHRTYREAAEVKPLQVFGGVLTNLCLRARYGGSSRTLRGLAMLCGEILAPRSFRGTPPRPRAGGPALPVALAVLRVDRACAPRRASARTSRAGATRRAATARSTASPRAAKRASSRARASRSSSAPSSARRACARRCRAAPTRPIPTSRSW